MLNLRPREAKVTLQHVMGLGFQSKQTVDKACSVKCGDGPPQPGQLSTADSLATLTLMVTTSANEHFPESWACCYLSESRHAGHAGEILKYLERV